MSARVIVCNPTELHHSFQKQSIPSRAGTWASFTFSPPQTVPHYGGEGSVLSVKRSKVCNIHIWLGLQLSLAVSHLQTSPLATTCCHCGNSHKFSSKCVPITSASSSKSTSKCLTRSAFPLCIFSGPHMDESDTLAATQNAHMVVPESQNQANTIVLIQWLAPITAATCPCI